MKKNALLTIVLIICVAFSLYSQTLSKDDGSQFKMHIRLWPDHHTDPQLRTDLLKALKKYRPACDVVWLCMECNTTYMPMEKHIWSAKLMGSMATELRKLGITPSLQGITLGHPNSNGITDKGVPSSWGLMVDYKGAKSVTTYCPRCKGSLDYLAKEYATYAREIQPGEVWLDDDLRLSSHNLVNYGCYCDTCILDFNKENGTNYTRETLVAALDSNEGNGALRTKWIRFGQESLACVAGAISRAVHAVSPNTRMGLQHANFHRNLLEGRDWNPMFDVMERETGLIPCSRPGSGFYDDQMPRGMFVKAYDMARQIHRLKPEIKEIAPEIEGWHHCATGKSYHSLCIESMLYLSMGCTQLSYAIICAAEEPMEWYAEHYLKNLAIWRPFLEDYAKFNVGTESGGLDPYISPTVALRAHTPEPGFSWALDNSSDMAPAMAPLGIPFTPDGHYPSAYILDNTGIMGLADGEFDKLVAKGVMLDDGGWQALVNKGIDKQLIASQDLQGLSSVRCYTTPQGGRVAVVPSYNPHNVNIKRRNELIAIADWVSRGKLPVIMETMAQMVTVPRVDSKGNLRSVTLINCSISDQEPTTLRMRGCPQGNFKCVWKQALKHDVKLKTERQGNDVVVTVPAIDGWETGWLAIEKEKS